MEDKDFISEIEKWIEENTDDSPSEVKRKKEAEEIPEETSLQKMRGGNIPPPKIRGSSERVLRFLFLTAGAAVIIMIAVYILWHPVIVSGPSMEPTLHDGEILRTTISISPSDIRRGSVVCIKSDGKTIIKRIVGLPGEKISFKDGYLYVNGEKQEEGFPLMNDYPEGEIILKNDEYYCLGDNRNNSKDSRVIGPVHFEDITGMASADLVKDYIDAKKNLEKDIEEMHKIDHQDEGE